MERINCFFHELATKSLDKEKTDIKLLMIRDFRSFAFKELKKVNKELHSYLRYTKYQNELDVDLKDVKEINLLISDIYHVILLNNDSLIQMKKNSKKHLPEEKEKCWEIQYLRDHIVFMIARYADYWAYDIECTISHIKHNQGEYSPDLVHRFESLHCAILLIYNAIIDRLMKALLN